MTGVWYNSLNRAVSDITDSEYVMAQDKCYEHKIVKRYTRVASIDEIQQYVLTLPHMYEMFRNEDNVRLYFDVDQHRKDTENDLPKLKSTLMEMKNFLRNMGITIKRKNFKILSACTSEKLSFHLIVPGVVFSNEESRKMFGKRLRHVSEIIDNAPYSRNCLLRCPLACKHGKSNTLKPVDSDLNELQDYNLFDYIVHCKSIEGCQVIDIKNDIPVMSRIETCTVQEVEQKLRLHGDNISRFRSMNVHRDTGTTSFYFDTVESRKCLSGSGRTHTSNNFVINLCNGFMHYKCLSPSCSSFTRILGSIVSTDVCEVINTVDETYSEPYCRPYELVRGGSMQVIKSEMGSGKTYQIRKLLEDNSNLKALIVCFRVELGQYMFEYMSKIKSNIEFTMYNRVTGYLKQPRLICQVNSLYRVCNVEYDVLILDEIESIIAQFSGVTPTKKRMCFLTLEKLIRDTPHVYALDAAVGERSLNVLRSIRPLVQITNTFKTLGNMRMIETNMPSWITTIFETISNNEPIAITSTNARWLVGIETAINKMYPTKNVLLIWSESTEEQKKTFYNDLQNVDVFLYSATLQAGISIDIVRFTRLFVYATAMGPTPAALHQMLARIRKFKENEIIITFDKISQTNAEGEEWTYDEMVTHVSSSVRMALDSRFEADMGAVITGFAKDWSRVYYESPFFTVVVYNILESFNGERH